MNCDIIQNKTNLNMRVFLVLVLINLFDFGVVLTKDYSNHIKENHKAEIQVKTLGQFCLFKRNPGIPNLF